MWPGLGWPILQEGENVAVCAPQESINTLERERTCLVQEVGGEGVKLVNGELPGPPRNSLMQSIFSVTERHQHTLCTSGPSWTVYCAHTPIRVLRYVWGGCSHTRTPCLALPAPHSAVWKVTVEALDGSKGGFGLCICLVSGTLNTQEQQHCLLACSRAAPAAPSDLSLGVTCACSSCWCVR